MWVICTAGHVDHGKTTLVTALTGHHPDRLAEEQRRGLTIDLGFAWTTLAPTTPDPAAAGEEATEGIRLAFVDLPGHERFVPNMLAGAGGVSLALFVVAADEGWMPQSAEHLTILELLGVRHAVVALTRADLVDEETADISAELVREQLADGPLADAPVVPVSSVTGAGLDDLRGALVSLVRGVPAPEDRRRPRLWIDRCFTVRGAGTVVTGTLHGGAVAVGDHLRVAGGEEVRVRGLQSLERDLPRVEPGWRVAVNVVGPGVEALARGDALLGGEWVHTSAVELWCHPAPGATIGRRGAWTLHAGTAAVPVQLFPVGGADLTRPGPVRAELAEPLSLAVGDRVVLRESGRGVTAGGGRVLEPAPPAKVRGAVSRQRRLGLLVTAAGRGDALAGPDRDSGAAGAGARATAAERVAGLVRLRGAAPRAATLAAADADADSLADTAVVDLGSHLVDLEMWTIWSGLALRSVVGVHQSRPALSAVDKDVPRRMLRDADCPPDMVDAVIRRLLAEGRLQAARGGVVIPGHEPRLTIAQQEARTALLRSLDAAGVEPPSLEQACRQAEADSDLVAALVDDGQLIPLPGLDVAVTAGTLVRARSALADLGGPFTASEARQALGTSRKYALPLLEAMDAAGVTARDGDRRVVLG